MDKTLLDVFMAKTHVSPHMVEEAFSIETIVVPSHDQHSHYKTNITVLLSSGEIHRLKAYTKEKRANHRYSIKNDLPNYERVGMADTVNTMIAALENEETAYAFETLVTSFMNDFTHYVGERRGFWSPEQWVRWTDMDVELYHPISYMHNQYYTNPIDIDYDLFYHEEDEGDEVSWQLRRKMSKRKRYSNMFPRVKAWFESFKAQKRFVKIIYDFT